MQNQVVEQRILEAMAKQEPKQPRVIELGGGYYYKCHWISCDNDIKRIDNYCSKCGQMILWEGEE